MAISPKKYVASISISPNATNPSIQPTKSQNHQLYQTQTKAQTIPPPLKPLGQVEILDQHSVKGAERLRADEVVPNLDKVPLEDAGMMR